MRPCRPCGQPLDARHAQRWGALRSAQKIRRCSHGIAGHHGAERCAGMPRLHTAHCAAAKALSCAGRKQFPVRRQTLLCSVQRETGNASTAGALGAAYTKTAASCTVWNRSATSRSRVSASITSAASASLTQASSSSYTWRRKSLLSPTLVQGHTHKTAATYKPSAFILNRAGNPPAPGLPGRCV